MFLKVMSNLTSRVERQTMVRKILSDRDGEVRTCWRFNPAEPRALELVGLVVVSTTLAAELERQKLARGDG
jgi:hypothetical protein